MNSIELRISDEQRCSFAGATLADEAILAHPNAFYAYLRHDDPVRFDPGLGMYLVSRFDDIMTVVRDPKTYSMEQGYKEQYAKGYFDEFKAILERDGGGFFPDVIMSDSPKHTRIRGLMNSAFSAQRIQKLESGIRDVVVALIDSFADRGRADGVNAFAVPMTIRVICKQLGLSEFDAEKIQRWSIAVTAQIGRMQNRNQMLANAKEICDLQNFLILRIKERQLRRTDDMISDLIYARLEGEEEPALTFPEIVSLCRALLIAGNETTATALGNLLYILATQPKIAQQLRESAEDDRLLSRFIEELLRIEPPVRGLSRMTTKETVLGGVRLPKGAHMLLLFASGNDDENIFPCPRHFDLDRENIGRQLAFSAGIHRCLGAPLARLELKIAAQELVRRLDNIKLAVPEASITYLPTIATHSIERLPLTFTQRQ